ncbi:Serine protease inhibitor 3 [Anthophora plagiata]
MSSKLFVLLTLFLVVGSLAEENIEKKCVNGKSYYDGCNWCSCHGGNVACTLKYCGTYNSETRSFEEFKREPPPADFWES